MAPLAAARSGSMRALALASPSAARSAPASACALSAVRLARAPAPAAPLRVLRAPAHSASPSPCALAPARPFTASAAARSKDTTWVNKGDVTYDELKPETEAPSGKITLIDVREPDEVAAGMIPSAVNVPLSEFASAFDVDKTSRGAFLKKYAFDRPGYDDRLIFHCRSGKRSAEALAHAQQKGWWNARNYRGSWLDWTAHEEKK